MLQHAHLFALTQPKNSNNVSLGTTNNKHQNKQMKKILIISKDESSGGSIDTFNQIAQTMNLEVLGIAGDYHTSVSYIRKVNPDLIICDVSLSETLDGVTTLQKVHKKHPIASILVSRNVDSSYLDNTQGMFIVGHLTKPFSLNQVNITLKLSLSLIS